MNDLLPEITAEAITGQPELDELADWGAELIGELARAHAEWGCGSATRWELDQAAGTITWMFADRVASAPAQILASYDRDAGTWVWAWANVSIRPELSATSRQIRDWAEEHGHPVLTAHRLRVDDAAADALTAVAFGISEATGFYKSGSSGLIALITFGKVTIATSAGEVTEFAVSITENEGGT